MAGSPGVFTCSQSPLKVQIMSVSIFARTGTEDGAKDRRKRTWQFGWSRVLSGCFCL